MKITRTFQGHPCKRCGGTKRYLSNKRCTHCMAVANRKHDEANREKRRERNRKAYRENPDSWRARAKRNYEAKIAFMTPEEANEWQRERYYARVLRESARDMLQKAKGSPPDVSN